MNYVELAREFFKEFGGGNDAARAAFRKWFTEKTRWENVGLLVTEGPEEAIRFHNDYEKATGLDVMQGTIHSIAADGNTVMMERTDTFLRADGSVLSTFPVMCAMQFDGNKIIAWRDYFDTVPHQQDVK